MRVEGRRLLIETEDERAARLGAGHPQAGAGEDERQGGGDGEPQPATGRSHHDAASSSSSSRRSVSAVGTPVTGSQPCST